MRTFYLKTRAVSFNTKNSFKEHLKSIRQRAEQNKDGIIQSTSDISDLKDFIQDYCDKSEHIQELFDLDNCSFLVKKSPNHSNKCLFIINNHTNNEEQISTTNFGNPPTPLQNFRSFCTNTITEHKKTIREKLTNEQGKPFDEMDLWHKNPTTKEIVDEFIQLKRISEKLDEVISPNGFGNNIPFLLPKYNHLQQEFLDFYDTKVRNKEIQFELKNKKS